MHTGKEINKALSHRHDGQKGKNMINEKEWLLQLIENHNAVIVALGQCKAKVESDGVLSAMAVWHRLACESAGITHMARMFGINAKTNMQSGEIKLYGDIPISEEEKG